MPDSNLDLVRRVYERWAEGDFQVEDVFDPLVLFVMGKGLPDSGTYLGVEAVRGYTRDFLEPWERITIEAEEMIEAGDSALVAVVQRGTGMGSGAATEFRYFHVWTFRAGKAIRVDTVRERADAMAAAGLDS
jgi:ketosteroid isomerase-like protein